QRSFGDLLDNTIALGGSCEEFTNTMRDNSLTAGAPRLYIVTFSSNHAVVLDTYKYETLRRNPAKYITVRLDCSDKVVSLIPEATIGTSPPACALTQEQTISHLVSNGASSAPQREFTSSQRIQRHSLIQGECLTRGVQGDESLSR
ncbi:hypothetical protein ACFX2L_23520, partial [Escherichia coli]|uniref:hypothetical protein n=1 Tax=Escherichia coli TaxID=562 RepID=UPI00369E0FEB